MSDGVTEIVSPHTHTRCHRAVKKYPFYNSVKVYIDNKHVIDLNKCLNPLKGLSHGGSRKTVV